MSEPWGAELPVEGYRCPKCGGTDAAVSLSGMLVLCRVCPWTEAYPDDVLLQRGDDQPAEVTPAPRP